MKQIRPENKQRDSEKNIPNTHENGNDETNV